jgi:hypothetical protein
MPSNSAPPVPAEQPAPAASAPRRTWLLAATAALARANLHTSAWVLMPLGVVVVLAISLRRATAR